MPYVSGSQRAKFHAMKKRGEISAKTVAHWDKASKGKALPWRKGGKTKRERAYGG